MGESFYQHAFQILVGLFVVIAAAVVFQGGHFSLDSLPLVQANGSIDRVIDGDTVDVVIDHQVTRVRLIGIDTPETVDPRKPVQCFGEEASQHLKDLLSDKKVTVQYDDSQGREDKYGRTLAYLILDDGSNVAEIMLHDGYGYEYTHDKPYEYQEAFKNAEEDARDNERGLWSSETCGGKR